MMNNPQNSKALSELMSKEQVKKPSFFNQILPYLITAGIFIYLYFSLDFKKMFEILKSANLALFIPAMIGFVIIFGLVDSFTFGQAYSWFNAKLSNYEKIECRVAPYVVQVILAPLAEVLFVLYLLRKKGIKPSHALSSSIWTIINDFASVATALSLAVIYNLKTNLVPEIGISWLMVLIIFWIGYFGNIIFWHSPLNPRLADWIARGEKAGKDQTGWKRLLSRIAGEAVQLLRTFSLAKWYHYLWLYLVRIGVLIGGLISNVLALKAVGIEAPVPLLLIAVPIIFYGHFLPINVGGYGGPQMLAVFFFSIIGNCGSKEEVAAYSFLWSTGFLVGRFLLGMVFLRGFWKNTFPQGFKSSWKS